jgi:hypothetical protein
MAAPVNITIRADDDATPVLRKLGGALDSLKSKSSGLKTVMQGALSVAVGGGLMQLAQSFTGAATSGFAFNATMENVSAQLNAFTKDGTATAGILDMIRKRAAATPFAFEDMAKATAGLYPVAKQSGQALEDLVKQAEILAASNPAQGLEGAAFSLKEAMGGDFTSIIERFNLSRQTINKLKAEGVPAMEIIRRAMLEMGYDASLVANMSKTWDGRLSTLGDTIQGLAAKASGPIFERFSAGLAKLQELLDANMPALEALADVVGARIGGAFDTASLHVGNFVSFFQTLYTNAQPLIKILSEFSFYIQTGAAAIGTAGGQYNFFVEWLFQVGRHLSNLIDVYFPGFGTQLQARLVDLDGFLLKLTPLVDWLGTNIPNAITTLQGVWGATIPAITTTFANFWTTAQPILQGTWDWLSTNIPAALGTLQTEFETRWPGIVASVQGSWTSMQIAFELMRLYLEAKLPGALSALENRITVSMQQSEMVVSTIVQGSIIPMLNELKTILEVDLVVALGIFQGRSAGTWAASQQDVQKFWVSTYAIYKLMEEMYNTILVNALVVLQTQWTVNWEKMKFGLTVASGFILGQFVKIEQGINGIKAFLQSLVNYIQGINWRQLAIDTIGGFVNGMSSLLPQVRSAGEQVGRTFLAGTDSAIDRGSPSKEMYKRGVDSGIGFILGAKNKEPELARVGRENGAAYLQGFDSALVNRDLPSGSASVGGAAGITGRLGNAAPMGIGGLLPRDFSRPIPGIGTLLNSTPSGLQAQIDAKQAELRQWSPQGARPEMTGERHILEREIMDLEERLRRLTALQDTTTKLVENDYGIRGTGGLGATRTVSTADKEAASREYAETGKAAATAFAKGFREGITEWTQGEGKQTTTDTALSFVNYILSLLGEALGGEGDGGGVPNQEVPI